MGLHAYRQQVQRLLHDTAQVRQNIGDIDIYINQARVQIALSSESIRQPAELALVAGQQSYAFSSMTFVAAPTITVGLAGVANVRGARFQIPGAGQRRLQTRAWERFSLFYLSVSVPQTGVPTIWARLQPGLNGTIWVAPIPDGPYTLSIDAVAYPLALAVDTDAEALPQPWTDAVPFLAAYFALLSVQENEAATAMFTQYQVWETRGTQLTTPSRLPANYPGGAGAAAAGAHRPIAAPTARGQ